jgi:hypothetical protein
LTFRACRERIGFLSGGGEAMAEIPSFELWLEFEQWESNPDDDPTDDFFNMQVRLADGTRYALDVWTFKFLHRARYPWPYEQAAGEPAEYLLPPDLFVERLDRTLLERVVARMLAEGEMKAEWLCPRDDDR